MRAYTVPDRKRSLFELTASAVPFVALWLAMWLALTQVGYWLVLLLAVPAAGFLVRLFMIQHDCGHGSVFGARRADDWLGRALGVLTLTPYDHWRHTHAMHHAGSGHLGKRGIGDVATLTVAEYRARGPWGRFAYRAYRHPLVLFGLGPALVFILQHRLPVGFMRSGAIHWMSTMGTNAAIAVFAALMMWAIGVMPFLAIHLPIVVLGSAIGVWLFYVQHQFEETSWDGADQWKHPEAALHGSSHYTLPGPLRWITANIGIHHVHHLSSRIPHYRLADVLRDYPALAEFNRLTLRESLRCVRMTLWDEETRRLVPFSAARTAGPGDDGRTLPSAAALADTVDVSGARTGVAV
ncbi:fatty acid desaturase [Acuticoccus yangtzensis]|uniref:fatty acid desaturase n=1 Tax=Acuticoccus yangtzensis TaxID=1443441 RepID=UPI000949732F|nr:fatty acid desaturase [Acuticoccus yangtzensis]